MTFSKHFKIKIWKTTIGICLLALAFNFSLVRAEETTMTIETPAVTEPAVEPTTTVEELVSEPVILTEPAPSSEVIATEELSTPLDPLLPEEQDAEDLTPLVSTTSEPIIFDFSPSADSVSSPQANSGQASSTGSEQDATGTPETAGEVLENNVAGASESVGVSSPILHEVITGIVRDANIKGLTILAQWQMSNEKAEGKYLGKDDSALSGAQFLPSGQFAVNKSVVVCALVADAGGAGSVSGVAATINYPAAVAKAISSTGEKSGCGQVKSTVNLEKQTAESVNALICDQIRNNNNNLLAWGSDKIDNLVYNYEHACGDNGLIAKQAVELYCAETALSYDDPAGDYQIKVTAKNNNSAEITGENPLKYLELTTFENDFSDILYGPVKLNETKVLKGDLAWGESTDPTVRNTGNTRLQIKIMQNDFGLGKTGADWNLSYQAKVGTSTDFINYLPEQTTLLNSVLELGQWNSMDFSVLINKFPDSDSAYWGKMTLSADKAEPLSCQ